MTSPWPTSVFGIPVIKDPIGIGPALTGDVNIVLHTTEGSESGDPRPTFEARGDAPHFAVSAKDGGTIWQLRSLDQWAAALRHGTVPPGQQSPNAYAVQIEICGFSQTSPWSLSPMMLKLTAAVMAYMSQHHGIPLQVPNPAWKDDCSDMPLPWAANNRRRQWASVDGHWPHTRGVWEHVEVPWQDPTWHYDCGALARTKIIEAAQALVTPPQGGFMADLTEAQQNSVYYRALEQGAELAGRKIRLGVKADPTIELVDGSPKRVTKDSTQADFGPDGLGLYTAFKTGLAG